MRCAFPPSCCMGQCGYRDTQSHVAGRVPEHMAAVLGDPGHDASRRHRDDAHLAQTRCAVLPREPAGASGGAPRFRALAYGWIPTRSSGWIQDMHCRPHPSVGRQHARERANTASAARKASHGGSPEAGSQRCASTPRNRCWALAGFRLSTTAAGRWCSSVCPMTSVAPVMMARISTFPAPRI